MFYKETNFKETPIGKIPKDWEVVRLDDIISLEYGKGLSERERISGRYPVVGSNGIVGYHGQALVKGPGIVVGRKGTIGAVTWLNSDFWPIDTTYYVKLKKEQINWKWLFFALIKLNLPKLRLSDVVPGLKRELAYSLKLPLPRFSEQCKIAEVLSTVDEAIRRTGEVIAKTERLKKGLMQTLLTRGIGHKEFKDTEIGRIPKEWEVVKLKDVVEVNKESKDPAREMPNETFIYVDIDSVEEATGKIRNPKRILGKEAPSRARRVIHENDVIMSTVRPYLKAFAVIPRELDNQICSTGFAVLSCRNDILPYFLLNILFSDRVINQCNRMMVGGQYPALNQSQVSEIKIPLPPIYEQQKIAEILLTIDKKLEIERNEKAKLERIKQGLMDLLLTGKIRVKVA
ncbi:MAG: restriction endonuclease subunit S [Nitrososphaerota archaeon]